MDFKKASIICNYLSKVHAEKIFGLLVSYNDISASEAASRLGLHIRTVQDFLDAMADYGILDKQEVYERKRPYFRYQLKKRKIEITINLDKAVPMDEPIEFAIREKRNSKAKFSIARNGTSFSAVTFWSGQGRTIKERKINLTNAQGKFLYHLPFPDAEPLTVLEIVKIGNIDVVHLREINNIVSEFIDLNLIEEFH